MATSRKKPAPKRKLTAEEKAAMKETMQDAEGEAGVLAKIAKMQPADRALGERIHKIVMAAGLAAKTWYGMPAYTKDGKMICYFRDGAKFKERYAMLGFSDKAKLDDGNLWPVAYSLTKLTAADEAKIAALVKRAIG